MILSNHISKMPKNKKNHKLLSRKSNTYNKRLECIEFSTELLAFLYAFQVGLKQLNCIFPNRYQFCFERNPLKMMPSNITSTIHSILLAKTSTIHSILLAKTSLSTMLVKRLLCVPGQVAGDHLRLGSCVLRRFFLQMCGETPLNKCSLVLNNSVRCVKFHPEGQFMAIGTRDKLAKTTHIFNVSSNGSSVTIVNPPLMASNLHAVNSVAWHPSAPVIATGGDDNALKLRLLSSGRNGSCISTHNSHTESVNSIKFNSDGSCIATGSDDKTAKLWMPNFDFTSWTCTATLEGHTSGVRSVEFHPTAPLLATASADKTVRLWRLSSDNSSANCVATLEGHRGPVVSVVFHPIASVLATSSCDKTAKLWRLSADNSSATCVATLEGHRDSVNSIAFHDSGHIIATGSRDKTAKLWRLSADNSSATCVATLEGHRDSVNSVTFHPKLPLLATGSDDNTVRFWCR